MEKKFFLFFLVVFSTAESGFAATVAQTQNYIFSIDTYFRADVVTLKNTLGLDSDNGEDKSTYLGIDYSLGFRYKSKERGPEFYLKLERNGPGDYDAPIWVYKALRSSDGVIKPFRNEQLLPQIEEFWLDAPLTRSTGFKIGLYTYEVGNGLSLNGAYENYGLTIYKELKDSVFRLYYCRPEVVYKTRLGPHIPQERSEGYYYSHNASNFFAADAKIKTAKNIFHPYVGVLADYTSPGKRDNCFTAPIKRDILGTLGVSWSYRQGKFSLDAEVARNFGQGRSADPEFKDVSHAGYLTYAKLGYSVGKLEPFISFLLASGNKASLDAALNGEETLTSGRNMAFSSYSPLNKNLDDSISSYNSDVRPVVAMGSGYGQNSGVPRPGALANSDFEDLIMPALGFDFQATEKLSIGVYGYYLMAFARPVGMLSGEARYLSRELAYEADLAIDYNLSPTILLSILGGYYIPGRYYKETRDDTDGSLFSPYLRGDGEADAAYQIEASVEFKF